MLLWRSVVDDQKKPVLPVDFPPVFRVDRYRHGDRQAGQSIADTPAPYSVSGLPTDQWFSVTQWIPAGLRDEYPVLNLLRPQHLNMMEVKEEKGELIIYIY